MKNKPISTFYSATGELVALLFDTNEIDSTIFPTPESATFQFGFGNILEDKELKAHMHKESRRVIDNTAEFLFVLSGRMEIDIYDSDENYIDSVVLVDGYGFLQFYGGHKVFLKAKTRYFELKQGPYFGQEFDKYFLE